VIVHFGLEEYLPIAMYIGVWVAFFLSVWRPTIGCYLLAFALPLQTGRYKLHTFFMGSQILDILLLGVILGLIVKRKSVIAKSPLNRLLLVLAVFYYLSLWEGAFFMHLPLPLFINDARFSDWKNYTEMFLMALVVASAIRDKTQVRLLILAMCLSVLIINRSYYTNISGRDLSRFSEDDRYAGALGYAGVNGFAAFEAMFSVFLLGLYSYSKRWVMKLGILGLLGTCLYCLLFAFSRGGYLGFLGGVLAIGILKSRKLLLAVVLVVVAWQVVLPAAVQERILMTRSADSGSEAGLDSSSEERLALWQDAIDLFKRNPITGTGFNTYGYMGRIGSYRDTHNYYVKVAAETGLVGLALYLLLLQRLLKIGRDLFRKATDPLWAGISLGFLGLVTSACVLNFFGDRWMYQQVDGYLWIILGLVISGLAVIREDAEKAESAALAEGLMLETQPVEV